MGNEEKAINNLVSVHFPISFFCKYSTVLNESDTIALLVALHKAEEFIEIETVIHSF